MGEKGDEESPAPPDPPPEEDDKDDEDKFVEMDPTKRYGRYADVLGKGAFKTVYRAFDDVDGIEVAWNQVKVQDVLQSPEDLERLYSEVHLLKTLKHKNIIKFYNSWVDGKTKNVNFITEIFTSGTLRQYRKKHKHCDLKAVKNWSRQILRGLLYLHSHDPPIIHRDLKCDNIFVNGNLGEVKIGDLGLAAILQQAQAAHSVIGTPEFMAPELYEEEYNELVDIYSFGMCLLEMVTFEYPYSECTNAAQIYRKVTSGKRPAALDKVKDPEVRAFVEKCLAPASSRMPARELLMDPFLSEGDRETDNNFHGSRNESRSESIADLATIHEEPSFVKMVEHVLESRDRNDAKWNIERDGDSSPSKGSGRSSIIGDFRSSSMRDVNSQMDQRSLPGSHESSEEEKLEEDIEDVETPQEGREVPRISRDFKVKGKLLGDEEGGIYLRLRIADPEGQLRIIHFPFDIDVDTAFSVASEMVAELDLSDQDVSNIAEMIDAEIMALVPDWRPGVSLEESIADSDADGSVDEDDDEDEDEGEENNGDEHEELVNRSDVALRNQISAAIPTSPSPSRMRARSPSPEGSRPRSLSRPRLGRPPVASPQPKFMLASSPPKVVLERGITHGRFWEEGLDEPPEARFSSDDEMSGTRFHIDRRHQITTVKEDPDDRLSDGEPRRSKVSSPTARSGSHVEDDLPALRGRGGDTTGDSNFRQSSKALERPDMSRLDSPPPGSGDSLNRTGDTRFAEITHSNLLLEDSDGAGPFSDMPRGRTMNDLSDALQQERQRRAHHNIAWEGGRGRGIFTRNRSSERLHRSLSDEILYDPEFALERLGTDDQDRDDDLDFMRQEEENELAKEREMEIQLLERKYIQKLMEVRTRHKKKASDQSIGLFAAGNALDKGRMVQSQSSQEFLSKEKSMQGQPVNGTYRRVPTPPLLEGLAGTWSKQPLVAKTPLPSSWAANYESGEEDFGPSSSVIRLRAEGPRQSYRSDDPPTEKPRRMPNQSHQSSLSLVPDEGLIRYSRYEGDQETGYTWHEDNKRGELEWDASKIVRPRPVRNHPGIDARSLVGQASEDARRNLGRNPRKDASLDPAHRDVRRDREFRDVNFRSPLRERQSETFPRQERDRDNRNGRDLQYLSENLEGRGIVRDRRSASPKPSVPQGSYETGSFRGHRGDYADMGYRDYYHSSGEGSREAYYTDEGIEQSMGYLGGQRAIGDSRRNGSVASIPVSWKDGLEIDEQISPTGSEQASHLSDPQSASGSPGLPIVESGSKHISAARNEAGVSKRDGTSSPLKLGGFVESRMGLVKWHAPAETSDPVSSVVQFEESVQDLLDSRLQRLSSLREGISAVAQRDVLSSKRSEGSPQPLEQRARRELPAPQTSEGIATIVRKDDTGAALLRDAGYDSSTSSHREGHPDSRADETIEGGHRRDRGMQGSRREASSEGRGNSSSEIGCKDASDSGRQRDASLESRREVVTLGSGGNDSQRGSLDKGRIEGKVEEESISRDGGHRTSKQIQVEDAVLQLQLKKEQVQKSIAELEAKTLENLKSKNVYLQPKKLAIGSSSLGHSHGSSNHLSTGVPQRTALPLEHKH